MESPKKKITSSNDSGSDFRLLPKFIQAKRAILNPMKNDHFRFGYAIVLFYHPGEWKCKFKYFPEKLKQRFSEHKLDQIKISRTN